jgi:hypothetical protein
MSENSNVQTARAQRLLNRLQTPEPAEPTCSYLFQRGENKGQACGKSCAWDETKCGTHRRVRKSKTDPWLQLAINAAW